MTSQIIVGGKGTKKPESFARRKYSIMKYRRKKPV
jgi:hypothetical protein